MCSMMPKIDVPWVNSKSFKTVGRKRRDCWVKTQSTMTKNISLILRLVLSNFFVRYKQKWPKALVENGKQFSLSYFISAQIKLLEKGPWLLTWDAAKNVLNLWNESFLAVFISISPFALCIKWQEPKPLSSSNKNLFKVHHNVEATRCQIHYC